MSRRSPAILLLAAILAANASAANLKQLVADTQRISKTSNQLTLVWWMPPALWDAIAEANPAISSQTRTQLFMPLNDYIVFALLRADAGNSTDARTRAELLTNARLDIDGKIIEPVPQDSVNIAAQTVLAQVRPGIVAKMGALGQSVEFVVYPKTLGNKLVFDPLTPGTLTYTLYDQTFVWHLPLESLRSSNLNLKSRRPDYPNAYSKSELLPSMFEHQGTELQWQ